MGESQKNKLLVSRVSIRISGEPNPVEIQIDLNKDGNLELRGIGPVFYELWEEELCLRRVKDSD